MYRLNEVKNQAKKHFITFQYFKCIGWIYKSPPTLWKDWRFQYFKCIGWINSLSNPILLWSLFQYFKCIGWMKKKSNKWLIHLSFNTSNVSVELLDAEDTNKVIERFQYFKCIGWILSLQLEKRGAKLFQYFKCIGWIE